MAFVKTDETFEMVNRLNSRFTNMGAMFKHDSDRLSDLGRIDKTVARMSSYMEEQRSKQESFMSGLDKLN